MQRNQHQQTSAQLRMKNTNEGNDATGRSTSPPSYGEGFDMGWQQDLGREQIVPLKAAPESRLRGFLREDRSPSPTGARSLPSTGLSDKPVVIPKKVYSRLSKNSPYIGFFHYAPR